MKDVTIHETACVDEPSSIGSGTKIWHFCHVSRGARIGVDCSFGQNVYIGENVVIGNRVRVQNNVSIYTGTVIEDDVFLGPSCVLTNVKNPRSQVPRKGQYEQTRLLRGSTIGANATLVCGITIGRYAFIAAGAVATRDAPDYALIVGAPGRMRGYVSRHGHPLLLEEGLGTCPESGLRYSLSEGGQLSCLDLGEDDPLPE